MATGHFNLQRFISTVQNSSLARTNRFEVLIPPPTFLNNIRGLRNFVTSDFVSLHCEVANFPPLFLSVKQFKIFGPSYQMPQTSEYGGEGLAMTFHVDRDMTIKRFFDDWMEYIVNRDSFTVAYQNEYTCDILVRQLDEANNVTYEIKLKDAFPRNMSLMDLNNSAQNQTHRLNVIFAYRYWRRTDIPENREQIDIRPRVTQQTLPVIPSVDLNSRFQTPTDQALQSVNSSEASVDFSSSTTGGAVSP